MNNVEKIQYNLQGKVDEKNTTYEITSGTLFTGEWTDVLAYSQVNVIYKTDQQFILSIQYSGDSMNIDKEITEASSLSGTFSYPIYSKFMRIKLVYNGGGFSETFMRLQTTLNKHRVGVRTDVNARIKVAPTDFRYQVALGNVAESTVWNKFGYNDDVDTGTEILASFGGTWEPLYSPSTLTIASTNVNDTSGGTGANSIILYGIDDSYNELIEIVTLNGTTNVVTTSTWLGINRVAINLAGSSRQNVGRIDVTATTDGSFQAQMPVGEGTTQQLIFHIPNKDKVGLLDWMVLNAEKLAGGATPKVTLKAWVYSSISNAKYQVFQFVLDTQTGYSIQLNPSQPFVVGTSSTFWIEVTTDTNNTIVTGRFSLMITNASS